MLPGQKGIKEVAVWLASACSSRGIAVLTGAGVSSESGIPTFRDKLTGLWAGGDPLLASPGLCC
jgi:NAD-dependent deacetylase